MASDVYVQFYDGIPATRNLYDSFIGFRARGHRVIPFEAFTNGPEESQILKNITRDDVVCCGIPIFRKVMKFLGVAYESIDTYPQALQEFFGRKITRTTLGAVRSTYTRESPSFFMKPVDQKLFTGLVIDSGRAMLRTVDYDDDTPVFVSDVVSFLSEHRVYVNQTNHWNQHGILGCRNYEGHPLIFPDRETVENIVSAFNENGPIAYAVDVGVIRRGDELKTVVVEVNDATCLGNYGLPSPLYAEMLEARYREIVG